MDRQLSGNLTSQLSKLLDRAIWCPACSTLRLRTPQPSGSIHTRRRPTSTLSSSTAVNATKAVPARYKQLHEALSNVEKKAPAQVNLSRLRLALQGLESENPTTRVAVLGLDVQDTARRLVRLLLADALESEEAWEKQLINEETNYSRGVLIRFGQTPNVSLPQSRSVLPILQVPSSILERNKIEILVSAVRASRNSRPSNGASITPDTFLSPVIGTPTDAGGRHTSISQPVHKAILVANGVDELLSVAQLLAATNFGESDRKLVDIAVNVTDSSIKGTSTTILIDTTKAEDGLAIVRESLGKAITYEEKWLGSGMPSLSKWLTLSSASAGSASLPAPIKSLITSLLSNALSTVAAEAARATKDVSSRSLSLATRASLDDAISNFSREAHQELQSGLASAWKSRNWRKLAWYKLFWRVDDVGLIVTDLVSNAWLPRTERSVYELSGRLIQTGISPMDFDITPPETEVVPEAALEPIGPMTVLTSKLAIEEAPAVQPVLVNKSGTVTVALSAMPRPAPIASTISTMRQVYMNEAILDLTSTAQQLVLRTLSITGLTAGLSGLAYFSITAGSVYEAGTIVALGTAFALRRMQTDWQRSCKSLEDGLMETGREAIRKIEEKMRTLVRDRGQVVENEFEVQTRKAAEVAVVDAQRALKHLN